MAFKGVDLAAQNAEIRARVRLEIAAVHHSQRYVGGDQNDAFEQDFAAYLGVRRVVSVNSGTEALCLALKAMGIDSGDEVITVPMAFVAAVEAASFHLPGVINWISVVANNRPRRARANDPLACRIG